MRYNIPDRTLREIKAFAKKNGIREVVLFGSRARGDNSERSDIDLAVRGGDAAAFHSDLNENTFTLLMFDVVDLDSGINDKLKNEIDRDGVVIYGETQ